MPIVGLVTRRIALLPMVLMAPLGCEQADQLAARGGQCANSFECEGELVCIAGQCEQPCILHSDCRATEACDQGFCGRVLTPSCVSTSDCIAPNACQLSSGARCTAGTCDYVTLADCTPCTEHSDCDGEGRYCGANGTCQVPLTSGADCGAGIACESGECVSGRCLALRGESCTTSGDCLEGTCECSDADCAARVCSEQICSLCTFTADGVACDGERSSETGCDDGIACTDNDRCTRGACVGDPTEYFCAGAECARTCLAATGDACTTASECLSGLCECADADCVRRVCAQASCPQCTFSSDGVTCDGAMGSDVSCDDGVACTVGDACGAGGCAGVPDDQACAGGECERAVCDPTRGCSTSPLPFGVPCSLDADPCTNDLCDGAGTCAHLPAGDDRVADSDGSCFILFDRARTWGEAVARCESLTPAATLATISDTDESDAVAPMISPINVVQWDTWVGGTDAPEEGVWHWYNGDDMTFTNWRTNEPNDGGTNGEDCMIVEGDRTATAGSPLWDDRPCDVTYPYICERTQ